MSLGRIARDLHGERGASAIVVAFSMILMLGFAALAVDVGAGFNERRQDQSAADSGVMAGALEFAGGPAGIRDEVLSFVRANLDTTYGNPSDPNAPEWLALWESANCSDPGRPAHYVPVASIAGMTSPTIDCISVAASGFVRVRVPTQEVETTFGRVLGVDTLGTSAFAEAKLENSGGPGGVLPFGILGNATDGTELCLSSAPKGTAVYPCTSPASGNFFALNSDLFGNEDYGTSEDCGIPGEIPELATNIAIGLDHPVLKNPDFLEADFPLAGPPPAPAQPQNVWNIDECSETGTGLAKEQYDGHVPIDTLRADTGYPEAGIFSGLVSNDTFGGAFGKPAYESRLQQIPAGWPTLVLRTKDAPVYEDFVVDNKPLWEYLMNGLTGPAAVCNRSTVEGSAPDERVALTDCLSAYTLAGGSWGQIFEDTIAESPRFAFAPQFWYSGWGSGNHWQPIHGYKATWIAGLWFNCKKTAGLPECDAGGVEFYAGERPDGTIICDSTDATCTDVAKLGSLKIDQVSGYLLPDTSINEDIFNNGPAGSLGPYEVTLFK